MKVTFLPDRERLALVVQDIRVSRRAFPLAEIASRFLSREDLYLVKLELPPPAEGRERKTFLQCLACKRVFRSRSNAEAHLLRDHLDTYFSIEETEVEPPTGTFTCVARCGLSGTLLGPPNYHSYNEKIQELWSSRFSQMSKGDYLAHIETLRDEALVEQWKDSVRKKTTYRLKDVPEGHDAESMTRAEAQDWMQSKLNPLLRESPRCIVPGPQSRRFDDNALRAEVSAAWQKESRFPLTLLLALRPAFRHMGLHLFKVNARETFVTAIPPVPVDIATAPDIVRDIILFLKDHPGIPRQHVLDQLRPGEDQASTPAAELLLHLGNLVAAGGVIEYFDGTLALPRSGAVRQAAAAAPSASVRKPGEADEPDEQASASTETAPLLLSVAPPAKDNPAAEAADLPPDDRPAAPHTPTTADIPIPTPVATSNEAVAPAPVLAEADTQDVTPPEAEKVEAGS